MTAAAARIRPGTPADLPAVLALIQELAIYERAPDAVVTTVESMTRDGFGPTRVFEFLVAEEAETGGLLGLALYFPAYSTWKGRMLYLEDLVVTEAARGQGLGLRLFEAVVAEARRQGARRVRWQVLDWNAPAIRFYERLGAHLDPEWLNGTLSID
ncbi:MAG: GNAT family N-acetyltransferase [Hymenobacteraceae bacterium]|nr:GNAT family N-acetyltransferase [Hymenobacteraceae bacterium]